MTVKMWAVYKGEFIIGAFPSKTHAEKLTSCDLLRVVPGTFEPSRTGGLFGISLHNNGKIYAAYSDRRTALFYMNAFDGCNDRKLVRGRFTEDSTHKENP